MTLTELLIVIGLVGVVLALLTPAFCWFREGANRKQCGHNLGQIAIAFHNCDSHVGRLPPALGWFHGKGLAPSGRDSYGNPFFHVLPYLGSEDLFVSAETIQGGAWVYVPWRNGLPSTPIPVYLCPSMPGTRSGLTDVGRAPGTYAFNGQVFASTDANGNLVSWEGHGRISLTSLYSGSNTILLAEKYPRCHYAGSLWAAWEPDHWLPGFAVWSVGMNSRFQVQPEPYASLLCDPTRASTPHRQGIQVALGDASVRTVSPGVSTQTWWSACATYEEGPLSPDW
jgi:hypothetical protein